MNDGLFVSLFFSYFFMFVLKTNSFDYPGVLVVMNEGLMGFVWLTFVCECIRCFVNICVQKAILNMEDTHIVKDVSTNVCFKNVGFGLIAFTNECMDIGMQKRASDSISFV